MRFRIARSVMVIVAMVSAGCLSSLTDIEEKRYRVDTVLVVLEHSVGPSHPTMTLVSEVFRNAATERWQLDGVTENNAWRAIREIRWSKRAIAGDGTYDAKTAKLDLRYIDCPLDAPLYRSLAQHYRYVLAGEVELSAEDAAWAVELAKSNLFLCDAE